MKPFPVLRPFAAMALAAVLATALVACSDGDEGGEGPATEQPGVFRTIADWAGSPDPGGPGYRDGTGSAARFEYPGHVAVTRDGSIYVTELLAPRLRRIDAAGRVTTVLDARTEALAMEAHGCRALLGIPGALVAAPTGGVFVAVRQVSVAADGRIAADGSWAVLRIEPGAPPQLAVLPATEHGANVAPSALALDRQGRLYVAADCSIWRSDGDVLAAPQPRGVLRLHASDTPSPGAGCSSFSPADAITRMTLDAEDRVLFTLGRGNVQRLEPDLRVTTLGNTLAGSAISCGGVVPDGRGGLLLTGDAPMLAGF